MAGRGVGGMGAVMGASGIDVAAYCQRKRAARVLDIDLVVSGRQHAQGNENAKAGDGRVRIVVRPDDSWEVRVVRADERHSLCLEGGADASAPAILREIADWLFREGGSDAHTV